MATPCDALRPGFWPAKPCRTMLGDGDNRRAAPVQAVVAQHFTNNAAGAGFERVSLADDAAFDVDAVPLAGRFC